ncbi:MAG TPA: AraC family transcriptional regulator [Steroidobacteraceae bacterium]|nr:AraC family transcriptional regulator [Steroidobacteraceae bacterium]
MTNPFSPVPFGRQYRPGLTVLPRHRHGAAYAALVTKGAYEEAGDAGRFCVGAGDVLLHAEFEAHINRYGNQGAEVASFKLPQGAQPVQAWMRVADPDAIIRLAERNVTAATALLLASLAAVRCRHSDWPEDLALALRRDPALSLGEWARERGLAAATVSRGFKHVFGVSPHAYRAQMKARLAWRALVQGRAPLATVAMEAGFSDQAHMTRTVHAVTGLTPGAWRKADRTDSNSCC